MMYVPYLRCYTQMAFSLDTGGIKRHSNTAWTGMLHPDLADKLTNIALPEGVRADVVFSHLATFCKSFATGCNDLFRTRATLLKTLRGAATGARIRQRTPHRDSRSNRRLLASVPTADIRPFTTSQETSSLLTRRRWVDNRLITDEPPPKVPRLDPPDSLASPDNPASPAADGDQDSCSVSTSSTTARARSLMSKRQRRMARAAPHPDHPLTYPEGAFRDHLLNRTPAAILRDDRTLMTPAEQRGDIDDPLFYQREWELYLTEVGKGDYVCDTWAPHVHPEDIDYGEVPDTYEGYAADSYWPEDTGFNGPLAYAFWKAGLAALEEDTGIG